MKFYNSTRDEFNPRISKPGDRMVALDFNFVGPAYYASNDQPRPTGIEIVVPGDATATELTYCEWYTRMVQSWFSYHGIHRELRYGNGINDKGMGAEGIIHTEPCFGYDRKCMSLIRDRTQEYHMILVMTLGRIDGVKFILPHRKTDPGAVNEHRIGEREFARHVIMPGLIDKYGESFPDEDSPQVQLTEV